MYESHECMSKILIAGMGNILRRDDGFGVEVAQRLAAHKTLPADVRVVELGIGGMHLVQELMGGYDTLVVIDALDRGDAPGTLHVLEVEVPDLTSWPEARRQDFLADTHYTPPAKALILAKALGVLPPKVFIVGCQPVDVDDLGIGLSESVELAASQTIGAIERIVRQCSGSSS